MTPLSTEADGSKDTYDRWLPDR